MMSNSMSYFQQINAIVQIQWDPSRPKRRILGVLTLKMDNLCFFEMSVTTVKS